MNIQKYFILNPVNQITDKIHQLQLVLAVPKSGCNITKKTGINKTKKGNNIFYVVTL